MADLRTNAHRLIELLERMRQGKPGGALLRLSELHLSFSHVRALHILACGAALPMKELAERLAISPPSVTALTRRLVQAGLVQRQPHVEDSRVSLLSITSEGRLLLQELAEDRLQAMERLLRGLSPEEQELFLKLLERAVSALQASNSSADR